MLHISYFFVNAWKPFWAHRDRTIGTGAGADPAELMEAAGMKPEVRPDLATEEPMATAKDYTDRTGSPTPLPSPRLSVLQAPPSP